MDGVDGRRKMRTLSLPADKDMPVSGHVNGGADDDGQVARRRAAMSDEQKLATMSAAVSTLLECLGEDPKREGLVRTPYRMAKALLDCTKVRRRGEARRFDYHMRNSSIFCSACASVATGCVCSSG